MATRGFEHVTAADLLKIRIGKLPAKPSKYRNVKVVADGYTFDSKREAAHYHVLKLREKAGEISDLKVHQVLPLLAPSRVDESRTFLTVSFYEADFTYFENIKRVVVDAKGKRTQMYALKKKWLELQDGIVIQEV